MQLPFFEIRRDAVEEREIGADAEGGELPIAGSVLDCFENCCNEEHCGKRAVRDLASA